MSSGRGWTILGLVSADAADREILAAWNDSLAGDYHDVVISTVILVGLVLTGGK